MSHVCYSSIDADSQLECRFQKWCTTSDLFFTLFFHFSSYCLNITFFFCIVCSKPPTLSMKCNQISKWAVLRPCCFCSFSSLTSPFFLSPLPPLMLPHKEEGLSHWQRWEHEAGVPLVLADEIFVWAKITFSVALYHFHSLSLACCLLSFLNSLTVHVEKEYDQNRNEKWEIEMKGMRNAHLNESYELKYNLIFWDSHKSRNYSFGHLTSSNHISIGLQPYYQLF